MAVIAVHKEADVTEKQTKAMLDKVGEEVRAVLDEHGAAILPNITHSRTGTQVSAQLWKQVGVNGTVELVAFEKDEDAALSKAIEKVLVKHQKRHPDLSIYIDPVSTQDALQTKGEWTVRANPRQQQQGNPTSRPPVEEVWCAVKHYVALEGHLGEMLANAAVAKHGSMGYFGELLAQATRTRRELQEYAMTGRLTGRGCRGCEEDRKGGEVDGGRGG